MGNYRFRLSDMMPNAWFYKLRDMTKTRNHYTSHPIKKKLPPPTSQRPIQSQLKHSYYYTAGANGAEKSCTSPSNPKALDTLFPEQLRNSSQGRARRKTIYKPSPRLVTPLSADFSSCSTHNSVWTEYEQIQPQDYLVSLSSDSSPEPESPLSEFEPDTIDGIQPFTGLASWSSSCSCTFSSSATDILIDMNEKSYNRKIDNSDVFGTISEIELPPILTKPVKTNAVFKEADNFGTSSSKLGEIEAHDGSLAIKIVEQNSIPTQKQTKITNSSEKQHKQESHALSTPGIKPRPNSPRLASRKIVAHGRKSVSKSSAKNFSESCAIVKSSFEPQKDFRDSMMEMIVENNIRASKDLEELLACYLSLNSDEYHGLIIKAFEQIWFNMPDQL